MLRRTRIRGAEHELSALDALLVLERLIRLITQIERVDYVKGAIEAVRKAIPDGAIEAEQERLKYGSQQSII